VPILVTDTRRVWLFTASVTGISILAYEVMLLGVHLLYGEVAFTLSNVLLIGGVIPVIVAAPVSYLMATAQQRLTEAHRELAKLARTDPLTDMPNRRAFFEHAAEALTSLRLSGEHATLMILDADHFKDLNDNYGHGTGDAALQLIASQLGRCLRRTDLACRLGGEEFAVLLPSMTSEEAGKMAVRIVEAVSSEPLVLKDCIVELSISCGYADTRTSHDLKRLYKDADDAMYAAKAAGRNRALRFAPGLSIASLH